MANQERKRRQEPDIHQPIREPKQDKHTVKPGQKEAKPVVETGNDKKHQSESRE